MAHHLWFGAHDIRACIARVQALPGVAAWVADALAERDFSDFEESYCMQR